MNRGMIDEGAAVAVIVAGGQTGVERAAWRAARRAGLATGGWMAAGYLAEDGRHPEFAADFGARECRPLNGMGCAIKGRDRSNVAEADALLILAPAGASSSHAVASARSLGVDKAAEPADPPFVLGVAGYRHFESSEPTPEALEAIRLVVRACVRRRRPGHAPRLMVAGPAESTSPGVEAWAEAFLFNVFTDPCLECRGSGKGEASPDGVYHDNCPCCSGSGRTVSLSFFPE